MQFYPTPKGEMRVVVSDPIENRFDVGPKYIPVDAVDEITENCRIFEVQITNCGTNPATVWISDRGETPMLFIKEQEVEPGAMISANSVVGRPMSNGFRWASSAAGVVGWVAGGLTK